MRMSLALLEQYIEAMGLNRRFYVLNTEPEADNRLCVIDNGDHWSVFFWERGSRWDEVTFESEEVACTYFLGLLAQKYIETNIPKTESWCPPWA